MWMTLLILGALLFMGGCWFWLGWEMQRMTKKHKVNANAAFGKFSVSPYPKSFDFFPPGYDFKDLCLNCGSFQDMSPADMWTEPPLVKILNNHIVGCPKCKMGAVKFSLPEVLANVQATQQKSNN